MGNIAPDVPGDSGSTSEPISHTLDGTFAGLIVVIVIGAIYITAEYRRGMIRTTFAATPARGQVLAAKAIVLGAVTFVAAAIGCALAIPIASHQLKAGGNVIEPVSALTYLRVVAGTAAVFAGAAILGLALGALFRRGVAAVTTAIAVVVVPYFLAVASPGLPTTFADWLMRVFPTAALSVQQTVPRYPQVPDAYAPFNGFYPLTALAGFAVLIVWTGGALWLAGRQLEKQDA
jgi:ABC-type transport system involved in multi-copper enzyme maturation permease subunit